MDNHGKINLLYVTSSPQRWVSFEWLCRYLDKERFSVSFAVLNEGDSQLVPYLRATGVVVHDIDYTGDSSTGLRKLLRMFRAARRIARCCRANDIHVVHAHFYNVCFAALAGALLAGISIRLYTRHYAHPRAMPHVPWKRAVNAFFINIMAKSIVAPSLEVKNYVVECESMPEKKVKLIYHGFDLEKYAVVPEQEVEAMRVKYGIGGAGPIVGVVSRYVEVKGIQYIIPAFKKLLGSYPQARLVLVSAWGDYAGVIQSHLDSLPRHSYIEIPFEENIFPLFHTFDIFVHAPIAPELEAFGQVYVEALAAGIPAVFTRTGIACEVMEHGKHAWMAAHKDSDAILEGLLALARDKDLCQTFVHNGRKLVREHFGIGKMIDALEQHYLELSM